MELDDKVEETIKKYRLSTIPDVQNKVKAILITFKFLSKNGKEFYNEHMFEKTLLGFINFPYKKALKGQIFKCLAALCVWYKREGTNSETQSEQAGGIARDLRNRGFIFVRDDDNPNLYAEKKGVDTIRKIVGFRETFSRKGRFDKKARIKFLKGKKDPFTGETKNLVIDHRTPQHAAERCKEHHADLTMIMIEKGEADEFFQAMSETSNQRKRHVCELCLTGGEIILPPAYEYISNGAYKKDFKDGGVGCRGCFWHNYKNPLRPECFNTFKNSVKKKEV